MTSTYNVPTLIPERRNEVWHQSDKGDYRLSFFDVQLNARQERTPMSEWSNIMAEDFATRLKTAFAAGVKVWAGMLGNEGEIPVTKPYLFPHACYIPEPGNEDKRRFYMCCRVKRDAPLLLPIDSVAQMAEVQPDERGMVDAFFNQMLQGFTERNRFASPEIVGQTARENAALDKQVSAERAFEKELEYRLNHRPF